MTGRLTIRYRPIGELEPYAKNSRTHTAEQIDDLVKSLQTFGWTNPVLVADGTILAGHARIQAATKAGIPEAPTIDLSHLDEAQRKAYVIADNRLAEKGSGWSLDALATEFADLEVAGFDLGVTGFSLEERNDVQDRLAKASSGFSGQDQQTSPATPEAEYGAATAMHRSAAPFRAWDEAGLIQGDVLDFGSGHEKIAENRFDPFHAPDYSVLRRNYDTVLCSYVLNVQPSDHLALQVIVLLAKLTRAGGACLVAVRDDMDVGRHESARGIQEIKSAEDWEALLATMFQVKPLPAAQGFLHWRLLPLLD